MISYLTSTKEEKSTEEQELKLAGSRSPTAIAPIINVLEHEFIQALSISTISLKHPSNCTLFPPVIFSTGKHSLKSLQNDIKSPLVKEQPVC